MVASQKYEISYRAFKSPSQNFFVEFFRLPIRRNIIMSFNIKSNEKKHEINKTLIFLTLQMPYFENLTILLVCGFDREKKRINKSIFWGGIIFPCGEHHSSFSFPLQFWGNHEGIGREKTQRTSFTTCRSPARLTDKIRQQDRWKDRQIYIYDDWSSKWVCATLWGHKIESFLRLRNKIRFSPLWWCDACGFGGYRKGIPQHFHHQQAGISMTRFMKKLCINQGITFVKTRWRNYTTTIGV